MKTIPKKIIAHFEESLDIKLSNKDWVITYFKNNLNTKESTKSKMPSPIKDEKYVITNIENLEVSFTVGHHISNTLSENIFTSKGISLDVEDKYLCQEKIAFLKSKKLSDEINKNIPSTNNISKNKIKL